MEDCLELRNVEEIRKHLTPTEGTLTKAMYEQIGVEMLVLAKLENFQSKAKLWKGNPELYKEAHKRFLCQSLVRLTSGYQSLDSSRPWLCYWILHALSLLDVQLEIDRKRKVAQFLAKCQSPSGGFGGGPNQLPHLAATYAAVNALVILGFEEAYKVIDRKKLLEFLISVKQLDGSFAMHRGGEVDIRGAYCALSVASLTGILTTELANNTAEWIISCQTYEGGFAGCPGLEAHGGYAFCGLAALVILNKGHLCDNQALLRWLVNRQMKVEGGFQGRTNKLVDSCYSFWQGGAFPLIYTLLAKEGFMPKYHLFNEKALQEYILICCQNTQGGMIDKPGKPRDIYHTCYALSGLSIAQHFLNTTCILGTHKNELGITHPMYNIRNDLVRKAILYFNNLHQSNDIEAT